MLHDVMNLKEFRPTAFGLHKIYIVQLICRFCANGGQMLFPYIIGKMIDSTVDAKDLGALGRCVCGYLILFIMTECAKRIVDHTYIRVNSSYSNQLKKRVFAKSFSVPSTVHDQLSTGELVTLICKDISEITQLVWIHIPEFFIQISSLALVFVICVRINAWLTVIISVFVPIQYALSKHMSRKMSEEKNRQREKEGAYVSWLYDVLAGMDVVRMFGAHNWAKHHLLSKVSELLHLEYRSRKSETGYKTLSQFVIECSHIVIYAAAAVLVIKQMLSVGEFVALFDYFYVMQGIYSGIQDNVIIIAKENASLKRISSWFTHKDETEITKTPQIHQGQIVVNNLGFGYENGSAVFDGCNACFDNRSSNLIIGKNGSGKSTLCHLLLGFYKPTHGEIRIDGHNIDEYDVRELRSRIAYVSQNPIMLSGTLYDNLLLGNKDRKPRESVLKVLSVVQLEDLLLTLKDGLDTVIDPDEERFSSGQLQRIAIARAILRSPRIMILDEATSHLDAQTEEIVWTNLSKYCQLEQITLILITHKKIAASRAERIYKIEGNTIHEL